MKVSELEGALLDLWVARAEGKCYTQSPGKWGRACINELDRLSIAKNSWDCARYFEPHKNWAHAGPIIERFDGLTCCSGALIARIAGKDYPMIGETLLIAAMRAYVASKFGEEVPAA